MFLSNAASLVTSVLYFQILPFFILLNFGPCECDYNVIFFMLDKVVLVKALLSVNKNVLKFSLHVRLSANGALGFTSYFGLAFWFKILKILHSFQLINR